MYMCVRAGILTYFIEIERVFAGHGTVEPCFQEARPSVAERMRSALVVLAHSTDPRVHRLQHKCESLEQLAPSILFARRASYFNLRRSLSVSASLCCRVSKLQAEENLDETTFLEVKKDIEISLFLPCFL